MKVSSGVKRRCTFGELIECFDNKRIPLSAQERATRKGPYRYYGAQNVVDHIDAYLFDGEYALIAEDGENLRSQKQDVAQIVEGQFWVNNHAHIIQANANADLWYLCALLNQTDISRYISGSAQPKLSQEGMRKIVVEVPDVQEQRRIGLLLRSLDRKIALNRRKIATLEKMAKEIYDYWFVQYDFPDANGRPYKSSGGEMVYSPELKREIPKGWRSSSLGEIMQIERKTVDPSSIPDQVIVHYSIPAFDENMYPAFCCASEIQSSKFKIDSEVVLLSKLNPKFKRIWDPPVIGEYSLCSTEFIVCKAKQPRDKPFIFEVLNSDSVQRYMIDGASSSTGSRSRFAAELLPDFPLAIPPQSVIDSFTRIAKLSHTQIKKLRIDITNLTALRDYLLPLLMNGQARIGGVA